MHDVKLSFLLDKMTRESAEKWKMRVKRQLRVTSIIFYNNCQATRRTARFTLRRSLLLSAVLLVDASSHRPEINRHPKCVSGNLLAKGKIIPPLWDYTDRIYLDGRVDPAVMTGRRRQKTSRVVDAAEVVDNLTETVTIKSISHSSYFFLIDIYYYSAFFPIAKNHVQCGRDLFTSRRDVFAQKNYHRYLSLLIYIQYIVTQERDEIKKKKRDVIFLRAIYKLYSNALNLILSLFIFR